ncbi:MAG: coenzyme F420-0:L-glutamate ligase [Propionibacteriales bacterium]|nr:coenzyme F420-0:L-glutamate ligase [Propionibacteriales bacterium]
MANAPLTVFAVDGIGEIQPDDDLAMLIGDAIAGTVQDGDILAITSKIVSKAEGRRVVAADREQAITDETVRLVASRKHPGGVTRIVENRNGLVLAAAGVDASNTPGGTVLLLPLDPDESARRLRASLQERFGMTLGIVITDTFGRPWRDGQTDVAIGAAGIRVSENLAGTVDAHGRTLQVTNAAVADEIAGAADLVKGKTSQCPVAIVRGLSHIVTAEDGPGARALVRPPERDMFHMGTDEACAAGYEAGLRAAIEANRPTR